MAPAEKLKATIKRALPMTGPQAPTLWELMQWYCMNTNMHGFRRMVVSRGHLRRALWTLLTLVAVGCLLYFCAQLVMNYYVASVSVTVQFHKLPFPAVTICNINPYKYSTIKEHLSELDRETKMALELLYNISGSPIRDRRDLGPEESEEGAKGGFLKLFPLLMANEFEARPRNHSSTSSGYKRRADASNFSRSSSIVNVDNSEVGFRLCGSQNNTNCSVYTFSNGVNAIQEWYKLHFMNIMAQIDLEKKEKMSYSAEELLLSCSFDGNSCDARNFTSFHHPLHGNCYTFNSGKDGVILKTSTAGSENGLQVVLHIEEADYNPFLVTSTGAKVVIHGQDEYPFIEDIGTEIETGTATSIGMHLTTSQRLSKPDSNCMDGSDIQVDNLYNKSYSLQICLHSCFQKLMVKTCGCALYAQPLPAEAQFCNDKKNPDWMYCYFKLHEKFVKEQLGCQETCKEACSLKEWTLTTSLAQWPSTASEEWMLRVLSWDQRMKNKTLNKMDLANLIVFYKDLNERFITEKLKNNVFGLQSNLGGELGFWMSCSVVCIIEIVEVFFIDTFCIILRRHWQKAKKWWRGRKGEDEEEEEEEGQQREDDGEASGRTSRVQGHDNPTFDVHENNEEDSDLPTFNMSIRLSLPPENPAPRTPPPNYSIFRHSGAYEVRTQ
ncbi:amiloride-sensitive sodium channel subunit gamma-like [Anolis carolinensis]|uniref:amiloride-sensitive sodium channel subunit gamma-like n=1 Tax=Anolis carolinensis TaxID=28377 RepID=UPI000203B3BA